MSRHIRLVEMTREQEDAFVKLLASCEIILESKRSVGLHRRWMLAEFPPAKEWLTHHRSTVFKDVPDYWDSLPGEVMPRKYGM